MYLKSLKNTCPSHPSQWIGELANGQSVYVRYRNGKLFVGIGRPTDFKIKDHSEWSAVRIAHQYYINHKRIEGVSSDPVFTNDGSLDDNYMDIETMLELTGFRFKMVVDCGRKQNKEVRHNGL